LAEEVFELEPKGWAKLAKGDWRKGVVAGLIRQRSLVNNTWLAEELQMGARNAVSRTIRRARERVKSDRKAGGLIRQVEKRIKATNPSTNP